MDFFFLGLVIDLTNRPKIEYWICPVYNSLDSEVNLDRFKPVDRHTALPVYR